MKKTSKRMIGKKFWISIILVIVIIGLFMIKNILFNKTEDEGYSVYTITEMVPLKLEGKVASSDERDISYDPTLGKISDINVENGQDVEKDAPILTYTNSDVQSTETDQEGTVERNNLAVQQAQENLDIANQKYNEATNKVGKAKQKLANAQDAEEKASINEEIQQLNDAAAEAANSVTQANQALQLANSDATSAANSLEQTRNKVTTVINAPISGQVTVDESATNSSEKPVIKITTTKKNIQGKVTEYDLDKLKTDADVTVTTIGSDKSAAGKIVAIAQTPIKDDTGSSVTSYQVTIDGDFPWAEGLSTTIAVPQKQMVVPGNAIQKEGDKEIVYVYKEGVVKKTAIETEMDSGRKVVKKGLNFNDKVILNPGEELKDNQEVQVIEND